jgi:hypothetical protein
VAAMREEIIRYQEQLQKEIHSKQQLKNVMDEFEKTMQHMIGV